MKVNLQVQKEKLMQRAKDIVVKRADELSAQHDLDDFEDVLDSTKYAVEGKSGVIADEEKITKIWQSVMVLFDNLH